MDMRMIAANGWFFGFDFVAFGTVISPIIDAARVKPIIHNELANHCFYTMV